MNPDQPNDTEVQRMLALKRHEQPPPAFFHGFSDKVIDRIQTAGPAPRPTWRQRLGVEFYGIPIYVCAVGLIICGLLVVGLIGSLRVGPAQRAADGSSPQLVDGEPSHTLVPPQSRTPAPNAPSPDGAYDRPAKMAPTQATLVPDPPAK
jgi:hypothetical protein